MDPRGYSRAVSLIDGDPGALDPFAKLRFEYYDDGSGPVQYEWVQGAGSSSAVTLSAVGEYTFSYEPDLADEGVDPNVAQYDTTELGPAAIRTVLANFTGQAVEMDTGNVIGPVWTNTWQYDKLGRLTKATSPSGLTHITEYGQGNQGHPKGYVTAEKIAPAPDAPDNQIDLLTEYAYDGLTFGNITIHPLASRTDYPNAGDYPSPCAPLTTSYDYQWSGFQPVHVTTTAPGGTSQEWFYSFGYLYERLDEDGHVSQWMPDVTTGGTIRETLGVGDCFPKTTSWILDDLGRVKSVKLSPRFTVDSLFTAGPVAFNTRRPGEGASTESYLEYTFPVRDVLPGRVGLPQRQL